MSVKANVWLENKSPEIKNLDGLNTWTLGYEGLTIFIRNEHEATELLKAVALIIAGMKEQEN
jgi:hypothetical protein